MPLRSRHKISVFYSAAHTHRPVYGSQSHGSLPTKPTVHSVTELLPECAWVNPRVTICVRITCVQASFKHRQHCLMVASFIICDPWWHLNIVAFICHCGLVKIKVDSVWLEIIHMRTYCSELNKPGWCDDWPGICGIPGRLLQSTRLTALS